MNQQEREFCSSQVAVEVRLAAFGSGSVSGCHHREGTCRSNLTSTCTMRSLWVAVAHVLRRLTHHLPFIGYCYLREAGGGLVLQPTLSM